MTPDDIADLLEDERPRRRVDDVVELTVMADRLDLDEDGRLRGPR